MQIPYDRIIEIIKEKSELSDEEIDKKIQEKLSALSGLISKEGAAHIVANELKIKLFETTSGKVDIKNVMPGMKNIDVLGKVIDIYEVRDFQVSARSGKVGSFIIADGTGSMRIVAWGSMTENIEKLHKDDVIKIENAYSKKNNDWIEIHLNDNSTLTINPPGEKVEAVKTTIQGYERKKIYDLKDNTRAELLGVVVQLYSPTFYEVCPNCGKRIREKEDFVCPEHGKVEPSFAYIVNFIIDDGTDTLRLVAFRNIAENLFKIDKAKMMEFKENPDLFEPYKEKLIGQQLLIEARIRKNQMFDRLDAIVDKISEPDAKEELKRYEGKNAS